MKKEMMVIVDTSIKFENYYESKGYYKAKQELLETYPDMDEYDLGYGVGYETALSFAANEIAGNHDEFLEYIDTINEGNNSPIKIVTRNSIGNANNDADDEDADDEFSDDTYDEDVFEEEEDE